MLQRHSGVELDLAVTDTGILALYSSIIAGYVAHIFAGLLPLLDMSLTPAAFPQCANMNCPAICDWYFFTPVGWKL